MFDLLGRGIVGKVKGIDGLDFIELGLFDPVLNGAFSSMCQLCFTELF